MQKSDAIEHNDENWWNVTYQRAFNFHLRYWIRIDILILFTIELFSKHKIFQTLHQGFEFPALSHRS